MSKFGPLVSAEWLISNFSAPDLVIIDASWRMPGEPPARADYDRRHIPNARFFDIDDIADKAVSLPHMAALADQFSAAVGALGVSKNSRIVVYDDAGLFSAARVWWNFRYMGHINIAVLNGGLPAWQAIGGKIASSQPAHVSGKFRAKPNPSMLASAADVKRAISDKSAQILDARPAPRFRGETPEPRAGLDSGHMPGAMNIPYSDLIDKNGLLKSAEALMAYFNMVNFDVNAPVITTCGSGVTAAILSLALETIGHVNHALYDGSWAEWGDSVNDRREFPVAAS